MVEGLSCQRLHASGRVTQGKPVVSEGSDKMDFALPDMVPPPPTHTHHHHPVEPGLGAGLVGERLVAKPAPMGLGWVQPEAAAWVPLFTGLPLMGGAKGFRGRVS